MNDRISQVPPSNCLDLHQFRPSDVPELIKEFLWSCQHAGITQGVIIHGKGTGSMRELTHKILRNHSGIESFHLGSSSNGENWGQTSFKLSI